MCKRFLKVIVQTGELFFMRKYKEKDYLYNLLLAAYVIFIVLLT